MKKIFTLLSLAALTVGLLGSCKKDDTNKPDPQGDETFEEIVKKLPGVYLSSTFYKMHGYGHIAYLNEDGTVHLYWFTDDDVKDGVDIDDTYEMSGTWEAFKVDEQLNEKVRSEIALRMKLTEVTDETPETYDDITYLFTYNNRNCVYSTNFGGDEFVEFDEKYAESTQKLEEYLRTRQESNVFYGEDTDEGSDTKAFPKDLFRWMSELPDDILLCDLTIPGSHDALSYRCHDHAKTQTLDAGGQFGRGIRFFDIRYYMRGNGVCPCHNNYYTASKGKTIKDDLIMLELNLIQSPRECVILMFNHNGEDKYSLKEQREWIEKNVFAKSLNPNMYVDFRPDLRLGDVRGKIVVLTRDNAGGWENYPGYDEWNSSYIGPNNSGPYAGRPHNVFWSRQDYSDFDAEEGLYKKVDYFKETAGTRKNLVTTTPSPDKGFNDLHWSINYLSGYYTNITKYQPVVFASIINPDIIDYLDYCNDEITFGIVPLDWVGRNKVYGGITEVWMSYNTRADEVVPALIKTNQGLIDGYRFPQPE